MEKSMWERERERERERDYIGEIYKAKEMTFPAKMERWKDSQNNDVFYVLFRWMNEFLEQIGSIPYQY